MTSTGSPTRWTTRCRSDGEPPSAVPRMMIRPPSLFNRALEGRFVAEAGALVAMLPILRLQAPRGRGPVMVLPGFLADDTSTILLRRFVGSLGYRTRGWGLGASRGRMQEGPHTSAFASVLNMIDSALAYYNTSLNATKRIPLAADVRVPIGDLTAGSRRRPGSPREP